MIADVLQVNVIMLISHETANSYHGDSQQSPTIHDIKPEKLPKCTVK